MKRLYLSLIGFMFIFSLVLTGCSSSKKEGEVTIEPMATVAPKNSNNDPFTIRVGTWFIDDRTYMKELKVNVEEAYKKIYPNAKIQWDILLSTTYADKLKAELASETAPDVFFHQIPLNQFVDAGYVADLSDQPWASTLHPGARTYTSVNGKVYAASLGLGTNGIWYNKKIFADLGLTTPKTWDEVLNVMDKIKAANIIPVGLGFKDLWTAQLFEQHMLQSILYGAEENYPKLLYDGKKKFTDAEFQTVMNRFQVMSEKGYFNKTALTMDWPQSAELFTSGKAAMIMQGNWMPSVAEDNFAKKGHARFEVGYFPIPDDKGYVNLNVSASESLSVNAKTKLMQQSKDLVSVFIKPDILGPYSIGNGSIPAINGMKLDYPSPAMNELLAVISSVPSNLNITNYITGTADISLAETVSKIVSGAKFKPADLQDAQDKMDKDKATIALPAD